MWSKSLKGLKYTNYLYERAIYVYYQILRPFRLLDHSLKNNRFKNELNLI